MKILAITDIHGQMDRFRSILETEPEADLLLLGGDLTHFGRPEDAMDIVNLASEHADHVLAVAGNCDSREIDRRLTDAGVSVHSEGQKIDRFGVFGVSAMPPWQGTMYEFSEEDIDTYLQAGYNMVEECDRLILVSHTPPRESGVDRIQSGSAVGSTAVRSWVDEVDPELVVSGHVHEAFGQAELEGSTIVNCGPAKDGRYATANLHPAGGVDVELKQI